MSCDLASDTCVSTTLEPARFKQMSAFARHVCAVDLDGALWCWGRNNAGQLGVGDTDNRLAPARVGTDSDWTQVSVGEDLSCGVRAPDKLFCWGRDIGDGDQHAPMQLPGGWTEVAAGSTTFCAIAATDGSVSCMFGTPSTFDVQAFPGTLPAKHVAVAHDTACVIDANDDLYCWGDNSQQQCGLTTTTDLTAETANSIPGPWQSVALDQGQTCAIDMAGGLSCWGNCIFGELGRDPPACDTPQKLDGATYLAVGPGVNHTCAVRTDGTLLCFGENDFGELASLTGRDTSEHLMLAGITDWTAVTGGDGFTCGLRADHEAWCWGTNRHGELGDGGGGIAFDPVQVDTDAWASIAVGYHTTCGIKQDGTLWCFGGNAWGQLGDGSQFERRTPVQIGREHDWQVVTPGRVFSCGIRAPGTLWCWGENHEHTLGNGTDARELAPVRVGNTSTWTEIAVTDGNACGIDGGELYCWGRNYGTNVPENQNRRMTSLSGDPDGGIIAIQDGDAYEWHDHPDTSPSELVTHDWTRLSAGSNFVCGMQGSEIDCYGSNDSGQLGLGTRDSVGGGTQETTMASWLSVDAGGAATCAIREDHRLACWGSFALVAAGLDTDDALTPQLVGTATWNAVSVGSDAACGIQTDNTLYCWGIGDASSRGDSRGGHERPTRVKAP